MELANGILHLEPHDIDHIKGDIDNGLTTWEAFENQVVMLGGYELKDIQKIRARVSHRYYSLLREIVNEFRGGG